MPHRRDFVRALALGALPASSPVLADDEPKPPTEADTRMALVLARFGEHLDDDAKKSVRGEVETIVRRSESLRKLTLDNGDGPFPTFIPYRAPLEADHGEPPRRQERQEEE